jgi:hypothetical protein
MEMLYRGESVNLPMAPAALNRVQQTLGKQELISLAPGLSRPSELRKQAANGSLVGCQVS